MSGCGFGESDRHRARGKIGYDVDERRPAVLERRFRALQRRPDIFRFLDLLAMAAERLRHQVEARITEIPSRLVMLRLGRPAAVQADDDEDRQLMTRGGVEFHRVQTE